LEDIQLANGARYRGDLVEKLPGDHVTIRLATGEVKRFGWDEIREQPPASTAPDVRKITLAAEVGYGFGSVQPGFAQPFGAGIALRGAYTSRSGIYVGGLATLHFAGQSESVFAAAPATRVFYAGPELGYEAMLGPFVVRPYVGAGIGVTEIDSAQVALPEYQVAPPSARWRTGAAFWPGLHVSHSIAAFTVGVDARYSVLTLDGASAPALFASVGARF
jgi:hypothetical protein